MRKFITRFSALPLFHKRALFFGGYMAVSLAAAFGLQLGLGLSFAEALGVVVFSLLLTQL